VEGLTLLLLVPKGLVVKGLSLFIAMAKRLYWYDWYKIRDFIYKDLHIFLQVVLHASKNDMSLGNLSLRIFIT